MTAKAATETTAVTLTSPQIAEGVKAGRRARAQAVGELLAALFQAPTRAAAAAPSAPAPKPRAAKLA